MKLITTIDLRNQTSTSDMQLQLHQLAAIGFSQTYIADRDAQYTGAPFNLPAISALLQTAAQQNLTAPWVGGGVTNTQLIADILAAGAGAIVLGQTFFNAGGDFAAAAKNFPGKLIVLIEAFHGYVGEMGSNKTNKVLDAALQFEAAGAAGIIYLEREREGFYAGVDVEAVADLAFALTTPLYITGGITTLDDLRAVREIAHTGVAGVMINQALLQSRLDPVSALALIES